MIGAAGLTLVAAAVTAVIANRTEADIPIKPKFVLRNTEYCPDEGYFFRRDSAQNAVDPGPCYLCFCKEQKQAVCWLRESTRCDVEKYHFHRYSRSPKTNETVVRRGRRDLGLRDLLFKDTTLDFFSNKMQQECKPYEGSFSDGCPPDDWCKGCTVCDCDSTGHWDCHILSFCNDEDNKQNKKNLRSTKSNKVKNYKKGTKPYLKPPMKPRMSNKNTKTLFRKPDTKTISYTNKQELYNRNKSKLPPRRKIIKRKVAYQTNKKKRSDHNTPSEKILNIDMNLRKSHELKKSVAKLADDNDIGESELGQMLVKRVMSTVRKMLRNELDKINATRVPRSSDKKPCPKKVRDSKAERMKKNNEMFMKMFRNLNLEKIERRKREALDFGTVVLPNKTNTISFMTRKMSQPSNNTENTTQNNTNHDINVSEINNTYFTYDVDKPNKLMKRNITANDTKIDIGIINVIDNDIAIQTQTEGKQNDSNTNGNLSIMPVSQDSQLTRPTKQINIPVNEIPSIVVNNNSYVYSTPRVHRYDVQRIVGVTKKFNLKTVYLNNLINVTIYKNKITNEPGIYYIESSKNNTNNFTKVISDYSRNIKNRRNRKKNRFNFVRYLRKLFNEIFANKKEKHPLEITDKQILRILCNNMKSCTTNKKNKRLVKSKLKELNSISELVLKSVKIIKGLLRLIELPSAGNTTNKSGNWKADIQKLNAILKGTYRNSGNISLTNTQIVQMNLVKQNTKVFIETAAKFTNSLNDIINNLSVNQRESKRSVRMAHYNDNINESFDNIKRILEKHNLLQNVYMNNIYKQLIEMEERIKEREAKVSSEPHDNLVVEAYSRNVVEYLRRLKNLAQALNCNRRKRRDLDEKQTLEHMLLLMEHLLKRNNPADVTAAPDGIDLLIDTIKNAPDIKITKLTDFRVNKPIKKFNKPKIRKTSVQNDDLSEFNSDSLSSLERNNTKLNEISYTKLDRLEDEVTVRAHYKKYRTTTPTVEDIKLEEVRTTIDDKEAKELSNNIAKIIDLKKRVNVTKVFTLESTGDDDLAPFLLPSQNEIEEEVSTTTKKVIDDKAKLEWIEENFGTRKTITYIPISNGSLPLSIYDDTADNDYGELDKVTKNSTPKPERTTTIASKPRSKKYKKVKNTDVSDDSDFDEKDPVEEIIKSDKVREKDQRSNKSEMPKSNEKIEKKDTTKELVDGETETFESIDHIMSKKQMDLLNSLDYGTEKPEYDDLEAKVDDKGFGETYFG